MNIIVIDDDNLVCSSLKIILAAQPQIHILATGNSGVDAIRLYEEFLPDVLLMDIRMEPMSGLEAGEQIIWKHPNAKILYLTTFLDDDYIIKALHLGAKGYMLKQNYDSIVPALNAVEAGNNVYGNEIITKLPNLLNQSTSSKSYEEYEITEKEFDLITKISEGLSNKEISELLFLSEGTIRNYISLILEKLGLRDRTQIAIFYFKHFA